MFNLWTVICIDSQSVFSGKQKYSHCRCILVYASSILGRIYIYLKTFSLAQVKELWMIKWSVNVDWKVYGKRRSWSTYLYLGPLKHKARMLPTGQRCSVCLDPPYFISQSHLTLQPVMPGCCFVFKYALKLSAGRTFTYIPSSPDTVALT